jgi:hypothetical protein
MAVDDRGREDTIDPAASDDDDDEIAAEESESRTTLRGTARRRRLPHNYVQRGLEWVVDSCVVDGEDEVLVEDVGGEYHVSLLAKRDWSEAVLTGSVKVPADVYRTVVPEAERETVEAPPTRLDVTVDSTDAVLRDAQLVESEAGPGEYDFEVRLDVDRVYGEVSLTPVLCRRTDCPVDSGPCASATGERVAEAPSATVEIDLTDELHGVFHPERRAFSEEEEFPPEDHLVHLVLEGDDAPQLFLNADHEELIQVLDVRADWGKEASLRDATFDLIEAELWPQLVVETVTSVDSTGEPEDDWQWDVLRQVGESPYGPDGDPEEVGQRLRETLDAPDELATLQRQIEDFVQSRVAAPDHFADLYEWLR